MPEGRVRSVNEAPASSWRRRLVVLSVLLVTVIVVAFGLRDVAVDGADDDPVPASTPTPGTPTPEELVVHMAPPPRGDDANTGTPRDPVASIERADAIAHEQAPSVSVRVQLAPGRYVAAGGLWTYSGARRIQLVAPSGRATFSGAGRHHDYLLSLRMEEPEGVEVRLSGLGFADATNGLSISRLSGVTLDDVEFRRIGSAHSPGSTGYAALSLVGASDIAVNDARFIDLVNESDERELIHAVYAAHGTRDVTVTDPEVVKVSGDPFRVRDGSHRFRVVGGSSTRAGNRATLSEWFDPEAGEEPSLRGELVGFADGRAYDGRPLKASVLCSGDRPPCGLREK